MCCDTLKIMSVICVCVCFFFFVHSPWSVHQSWVQYHAADGELGLEQSGVFDDDGLAFPVAVDQRTKVDITCRCDLVTNQREKHTVCQDGIEAAFSEQYFCSEIQNN